MPLDTPAAPPQGAGVRRSLSGLLLLSVVATGCATSHGVYTTPSGLTIHTFTRDFTNAHVVVQGEHSFMVDSGHEAQAPALADDLRAAGLDPARLRAIVLTHAHADHAGGAGYFQRTFGTPVVVGRGDEPGLAAGKNERLCPTSAMAEGRLDEDQHATFTPYAAGVVVDEALELSALTGIAGQARHLPGHTPGSVVVIVDGAVLVGDLFRGAIMGTGAERHFYMCDLADNAADIAQVLDTWAPAAELHFTGHFGPVARARVREALAGPLAAPR